MISIRKIGIIGRTYRHMNRYRQIISILIKYGFGNLIDTLKIDRYLEMGLQIVSGKRRHRLEKLTRAERVRLVFEELGPTYIKLGQMFSTRPDLIPVTFIDELVKLQDKVPASPFEEIKEIIQAEFGLSHEDLFLSFDETPLASASIGQVYLARLIDGESVAVKIQRPGIRKSIEVDLEIMLHLATLMEQHLEEFALHRPIKIVEEFADILEKEIDYSYEAAHMERMARQFLDNPKVYIPKVFRDMSTSKVITMEFVDGIKISDIDRLDQEDYDRKLLTRLGANIYLTQIFDYGFFHGDPHPGNIFVLPDHVICLLDFGMVGRVDRRNRELFVDLVESIVKQNESHIARILLELTLWEEAPDIRILEKDVDDFIIRHLFKPLKEIEIDKLFRQLFELASRHRLRIPPNLFLMMKTLGAIEGVARTLDPEFDMIEQISPFIERIKLSKLSPKRIADDSIQLGLELLKFFKQFPRDVLEITRQIRQRKFYLKIEQRNLATMLSTYDQISNRISFSVIIAALIIGSALIVISEIPPLFYGISLIGIIGFFAAAIMGIWLLFAILKKGRL